MSIIYVSASSPDEGESTLNAPFRHPQSVVAIMQPGDTIVVLPGIYMPNGVNPWVIWIPVCLGTAENPITWEFETGAVLQVGKIYLAVSAYI